MEISKNKHQLGDPQINLSRLLAVAPASLPQDLAVWLVGAINEFQTTGKRLDQCLGLRQAGKRTPATRRKLETRDYWLRVAADFLPAELTPPARAERLAEAIEYYKTRISPSRKAPEKLNSPLREICIAEAEGVGLPASKKHLGNILNRK
jgi:hypothetical protein